MKNFTRVLSSMIAFVTFAGMTFATPVVAEQYGQGFQSYNYNMSKGQLENNIRPMPPVQRPVMPIPRMGQVVSGTVSNVSGDILTISVKRDIRPEPNMGRYPGYTGTSTATSTITVIPFATTTTYTVDATNAKIFKGNATTTVASIVTGDMVFVQGTWNASSTNSIIAKTIFDMVPVKVNKGEDNKNPVQNNLLNNGQPIVMGSVSAVSSSTLTVTSMSVTYSVDVTSANIFAGNASSTIANIAVGDKVLVQGAVNGTLITATTVIDQNQPVKPAEKKGVQAFFGSIGSFFSRFFHF